MKSLSLALKSHLAQEVTSLCTCWKATLTNGIVYGFTDHTQTISFEGVSYLASTGYTPTAVATTAKLDVNHLDIQALLSAESITDADLFAGRWDYADIELFQVNYSDLSQGALQLRKGWLGEISAQKSSFNAELRGLTQKLQQSIGRIFSPACDAALGDVRCKVILSTFSFAGTVNSVLSRRQILSSAITQATGYFDYGLIQWLTGNNSGLSMEVKTYTLGNLLLQLPMSFDIQAGDTFNVIAGCAKRLEDCKTKFNNVVNFRGFPHVPGTDQVLRGPD